MTKIRGLAAGAALLALAGFGPLDVQAGSAVITTDNEKSNTPLADWWNGKYGTGEWLGLRPLLVEHGLTLSGEIKGNFLAIVDGGLQQRGGYDQEIKFRGLLDVAKLTGWEALNGFSLYSDVRYRDGDGIVKYAGTSSMFAPSTFQAGKQWRLLNAYATYTTPQLFGIKEFLTLSGGWQNPSDVFLKQPESKFFLNNTILSGRGMSINGVPWGASYAAWGGYAKVKPVDWYYLQSGMYLAIPEGSNTRNHGLDFQGYHPNPSLNGIYWITETGFTPKLGPSKLPGRYAMGFIYWGVENTSFYGEKYDQRLQFYWQADQMLFREPSAEEPAPLAKGPSDGKSIADGKSFKEVAAPAKAPKLSDQGLYFFSLFDFAPSYNSKMPFYFQTGLIYKGLIPTRDADQLGVAIAYGNYSYDQIQSEQNKGDYINQVYEAVIEFDYRIQVNQWAYIQPDLQYIIRPGGTGQVENDTILGFQFGVTF